MRNRIRDFNGIVDGKEVKVTDQRPIGPDKPHKTCHLMERDDKVSVSSALRFRIFESSILEIRSWVRQNKKVERRITTMWAFFLFLFFF